MAIKLDRLPRRLSDEQTTLLALLESKCGVQGFNEALLEATDNEKAALLDFSNIHFEKVPNFEGVTFTGQANFKGAVFAKPVVFSNSAFTREVDFSQVEFREGADFSGVSFWMRGVFSDAKFARGAAFLKKSADLEALVNSRKGADFSGTSFEEEVDFTLAEFREGADFTKSTFIEQVDFSGAELLLFAEFEGVTFGRSAVFRGATFSKLIGSKTMDWGGLWDVSFRKAANFKDSRFKGLADFSETTFEKGADFSGDTAFEREANFLKTTFRQLSNFSDVTFKKLTCFSEATFLELVMFNRTIFGEGSYFSSVTGESLVLRFVETNFENGIPDFTNITESASIDFDRATFRLKEPQGVLGLVVQRFTGLGIGGDPEEVNKLRVLRGLVAKNINTDLERECYQLERSAEAGRELRVKPLVAIRNTVLLVGYRWSSDYGRGVLRPFIGLLVVTFVFYFVYIEAYIGMYATDAALTPAHIDALRSLTLSNLLPVALTSKPAYAEAANELFCGALIPLRFQVLSLLQGATTVVLLFLMGLGLRNYFRLK